MTTDYKQLFWKETDLLDNFKKILTDNTELKTVSVKDFKQLIKEYEALLKQLNRLTQLSDKQQNKLNIILERLSKYVSPPLYKKITSGKEKVEINKTKRVKLTIFFSDIKDFSNHSSNMDSEELSVILNSYLEEMTNIIHKYGGTLDKYIGDAILVFFGDPDFVSEKEHAKSCVAMAIEMRNKMKELQKQWFELGFQYPLHIRMGITTGYVSVGNFGSQERMDYTVIGNPVNLASRLQSLAAEDQILICHETWSFVKDFVHCSDVLHLKDVKGFYTTVLAYQLYDFMDKKTNQNVIYEDKQKNVLLQYDRNKITKEELIKIITSLE